MRASFEGASFLLQMMSTDMLLLCQKVRKFESLQKRGTFWKTKLSVE